MFNIQEELKKLPSKPGVYLMKDKDEDIIYIGKSKCLKNRVRSYFTEKHIEPRTESLVRNIIEFEYIVTNTEVEALILESNLIKKHQPRYNVRLKDDKSYPYIKITTNEKYPLVLTVHRIINDKAKYFGPYTSRYAVNEIVELIHEIWSLRRCYRKFPRDFGKERPCLNYYIEQCLAPCTGKVPEEKYNEMISEITEFLNGKHEIIIDKLEKDMFEYSEKMEYEKAAKIREKIMSVGKLSEKQNIELNSEEEQDIIAFSRVEDEALFQVFFIRGGKMLGREHFMLNGVVGISRKEVMTSFLKQFYNDTSYIPKELVLEEEIDDFDIIRKWLSDIRGFNVTITVPKKGNKLRLIKMAHENAILTLEQFGEKMKNETKRTTGAVREIEESLNIDKPIRRIEAYDISNVQGYESVASMIVFEDGKPKRTDYRKFRIKSVIGADDYASIEEVITRRFMRYKKEQEEYRENKSIQLKFSSLPDIILIDGGKGQITSVNKGLDKVGISVPVCGMVKDEYHSTRGLIFKGKEVFLDERSEGFKLITRIQNEVHRFAIEYHRKLREKILVRSVLDDIEGIGEVRRKELIKHFGSVEKIKRATINELEEVKNINKTVALSVYNFFRENN